MTHGVDEFFDRLVVESVVLGHEPLRFDYGPSRPERKWSAREMIDAITGKHRHSRGQDSNLRSVFTNSSAPFRWKFHKPLGHRDDFQVRDFEEVTSAVGGMEFNHPSRQILSSGGDMSPRSPSHLRFYLKCRGQDSNLLPLARNALDFTPRTIAGMRIALMSAGYRGTRTRLNWECCPEPAVVLLHHPAK